ncbi:MAG: hypothetical protein H7Y17_07395 [Chlorobia bacterium]|nr:hypothetical protein [Fimbriimonadaceae bacterium]
MNFLAQTAPTGLTDVLLIPGLCFILGLGLWYGGIHFENRTEKSWLKWLAFVPLIIGVVIGLQMTMQAGDYTYQRLLGSKKLVYGHYLALALPLGALITVICWHFYLKKGQSYDRF